MTAHQRDQRQVEPFGDHLRPDQNIRFMIYEAGQKILMGIAAGRGVSVPADDAGMGPA